MISSLALLCATAFLVSCDASNVYLMMYNVSEEGPSRYAMQVGSFDTVSGNVTTIATQYVFLGSTSVIGAEGISHYENVRS